MEDRDVSAKQSEKLDCVLELFRTANTDEQRFALLLMIGKLAPDDVEGHAEYAVKIYEAIGVRFIRRLLLSKTVPEGCPRDVFCIVAVNILAAIVTVPDIVRQSEVLEIGDIIVDVIDTAFSEPNDASGTEATGADVPRFLIGAETCSTAIEVLAGIVAVPEGRSGNRTSMVRRGADRVITAVLQNSSSTEVVASRAVRLLAQIVEDSTGSGVLCGSARTMNAVVAMANCMAVRNDATKLEALKVLLQLLEVIKGSYRSDSATSRIFRKTGMWTSWIAYGVWSLLRSRLGPMERDSVLHIAALVTELTSDIDWLTNVHPNVLATAEKISEFDAEKLLLLVMQIVTVELRMGLEDRAVHSVISISQRIVSCYMIVEHVVVSLSSESSRVGAEAFTMIHNNLTDCMKAIVSFILTLRGDCNSDVSRNMAYESSGTDNAKQVAIVLSSIRVLGSWYAEESSNVPAQAVEAFCFILSQLDQCRGIKGVLLFKDVEIILQWLLPSLCHMTASDESRMAILENNCHAVLCKHLCNDWIPRLCEGNTLPKNTELLQSAITSCGVLLNAVVLSSPYVLQKDDNLQYTAKNLFNIIVKNSLATSESILLFANAVVIVLRMLIHASDNIIADCGKTLKNENACETFIHRIVPFLIESNVPGFPIVAEDQEEITMLKGLAQQALHACIAAVPAVRTALKLTATTTEKEMMSALQS